MDLNNFSIYFITLFVLIPLSLYLYKLFFNNDTFNISNKNNKFLGKLPNSEQLLKLESIARKEGSGIDIAFLSGKWKFIYVWNNGSNNKNIIASYFLRIFQANLNLIENDISDSNNNYNIVNSIQFGNLFIRFCGSAELKGKQPILPFYFERIELNLGEQVLISKALDIPEDKNRPFFSLIAINKEDKWLSARGRGGGLALWLKD